jgi:tetratricopeptide (TPR) repeat protein/TolB-like protein/predicted Ser/Thr protein kinase
MIGKTISHYKILEKLGEGGMGVVYKAEDTKLDRLVALKFLPSHLKIKETDLARFVQEAKAAAALNHPNVCTIHEIHDEGENPFIVMEYVEGKTLKDIVGAVREPPLQIPEVIRYAIQIAEALKSAHRRGIIHRDIKSENIMVTEDGIVKVMDFGLAKLKGSVKLTKSSSTVGTMAYMSPEHLEGKEVDGRTDIFSFGVVLYEMLAGQLPFKGEYDSAMMYSILNEEPEPVQKYRSDLSSESLHILNRALEKDPEARYQSVNDMLIDLKRLRRDTDKVHRETIEEVPVADRSKVVKKSRKRFWLGVSAAAVLMIFVFWFISLKPFRKGPEAQAVRENSIAVMYFEDRSGEEHFGKILAEMLTSNLSRCKQIDVVSSQHLFDILKRMGMEDIEAIDRNVATEVAASARVQTMLLGSIDKIDHTLNVNAQLCDVGTGSVIGPAQAQGSSAGDVYQMVNRLTEEIIDAMGVSRPDDSQLLKINDVTTHSFEAYKHYQKGLEHIRRFNWGDAREEFRAAVQIDTTFAMAHSYLALSRGVFKFGNPLSDLSSERESMRLAKKYFSNVTEREVGVINWIDALLTRDIDLVLTRAKELAVDYPDEKEMHYSIGVAHYIAGNYEQAVQSFNRTLEIDPKFPDVYNMLSYVYSRMNEHEKAISAVRNYIALLPDVGNTYGSAFDIYLMAGRYEEAYQVCEDALKRNPDWTGGWFEQHESYIHLFRGEGDKAREKNRNIAKLNPSMELDLVDDLGCFHMVEGRYREAVAEFQRVVDLAYEKKNAEREIEARLVLGRFYSVQRKFSEAIKEFSEVKERSREVYGQSYNTWPVRADYYSGVAEIRQGDYDEALATAERIQDYIVSSQYDDILMDYYYMLLAEVHVTKAQNTKASDMINKVSRTTKRNFPCCRRLTADLLVMQGRIENAIHAYQELYDDWVISGAYVGGDFFDYFQERSLVHYRVARLYEQKGDHQQAILYYQRALDQWKNADDDMPELINAKARLAKLKDRR